MMKAFTLIEVVVGLAISSIIATAAIGVVAQANRAQVEGAVHAQAESDAELVANMMQKDLAYLGAGVPRGFRYDTNDFTGGTQEAHQLRPPIRLGHADNLVFVGDLPYPNAELNGVVQVLDVQGAGNDHLYVASQLSPCVPQSSTPGSYSCKNQTAALVPSPGLAGGFPNADQCKQGQVTRLCPWGMNKWEAGTVNGVHLVIGAPAGSWYERQWDGGFVHDDPFFGIDLGGGGSPNGNGWHGGGESLKNSDLPDPLFSKSPGAFASTVDRVFWSWEDATSPGSACPGGPTSNCVLLRRQCWGRVLDPGAADFPKVSDAAFRSGHSGPTDCDPTKQEGTPWETVATGVSQFNVAYYDDTDTEITGAWDEDKSANVFAVQIDMEVTKPVPSTTTTTSFHLRRKFFLDNRGGLTDQPEAPPPAPAPTHGRGHHPPHGHCHGHSCGGDHG